MTPHRTTHPAAPASHPHEARRDAGAAQAAAAIALALAAALMIPLLIISSLSGTPGLAACGQTTTITQPGTTTDARTGIPADYLHLYQAAGRQYQIPWNLLAAIGKIESDHGRDPGTGVHTGANQAGAAGPMQIGVGGAAGNNCGGTPRHPAHRRRRSRRRRMGRRPRPRRRHPRSSPVLLAHGAPQNLPRAVFAYNHDPGYVRRVMAQATRYATGTTTPDAVTGLDPAACPGDVGAFTNIPGGAAATVLAYARAQIGKPYLYGGEGPDSFDCSGLTMMAYRAARITIPRLSDAQYWHGKHIPAGTEQPGDLVFFDYRPGHTGPGHVGIVERTRRIHPAQPEIAVGSEDE